MIKEKQIFTCIYCGESFSPKFPSNSKRPRKYCSLSHQMSHRGDVLRNSNINEYNKNPNHCECCNLIIPYDQKENKYCSLSCAAKINNSNRQLPSEALKTKISAGLFKYYSTGKHKKKSYISWCQICGKYLSNTRKLLCGSIECKKERFKRIGQKGGKASSQVQVRRSKDEIKLYELCKAHFISVDHNIILVDGWDADIIIHDTKTAILWNGPWHYKDMNMSNHSLSQVQNRDKIKTDLLTKNGWKVITFNDNEYTPQMAFTTLVVAGQEI